MRRVPLHRRRQFYTELADALFDIMKGYKTLPYRISRMQALYLLKRKTTLDYAQRATQLPQLTATAMGHDFFSTERHPTADALLTQALDPLRMRVWKPQMNFVHIISQHPDMCNLFQVIEQHYGVRTTVVRRRLGVDTFSEVLTLSTEMRTRGKRLCFLLLTDHSPTGTQIREYFPRMFSEHFARRMFPGADYDLYHVAVTKAQITRHKLLTRVEAIPTSVRLRALLKPSMTTEEQWRALARTDFYRGTPLYIFDWVKANGSHICQLYALDPQTLWDKLTAEIEQRVDTHLIQAALQEEQAVFQQLREQTQQYM